LSTAGTTLERRAAGIDPRMRARRIAVQRGAGRRRLHRLVDVALLLTVAAGFGLALRSPLLDVDEVRVRGNQHTSSDEVVAAAGIVTGDLLMEVDLQAAGERIAQLPWVHRVELHRGVDGAIDLRITERTAVAVVGEGLTALLVDADGRVLAPISADPRLATSLVQVEGLGAGAAPGDHLGSAAADALAVATRIAGVPDLGLRLSMDGEELVGHLEAGTLVRFGDAGQVDAKVRSLRAVLEQVDLACAATIDLRSPGSPVLTRDEACS
jgi:cell division protein FtsQ